MLAKEKHTAGRPKQQFSAPVGAGSSNMETRNEITTRRVWIKKGNSTPTTVKVNSTDIVDDLKLYIINKFPNSLAKSTDPADLIIKVAMKSSSSSTVTKNLSPVKPPQGNSYYQQFTQTLDTGTGTSPKPFSPIGSSFNMNNYRILDPDVNVWQLLDSYFPNGMTMLDAFIVDDPSTQLYVNHEKTPSASSLQTQSNDSSTSKSNANFYHQPVARHLSLASASSNPRPDQHSIMVPSNETISMHKRSQSNPPESPSTMFDNKKTTNTNNQNSSAVLLIPKNFSFANGGSANQDNYGMKAFKPLKKSLSIDLSAANSDVRKDFSSSLNRVKTSNNEVTHPLEKDELGSQLSLVNDNHINGSKSPIVLNDQEGSFSNDKGGDYPTLRDFDSDNLKAAINERCDLSSFHSTEPMITDQKSQSANNIASTPAQDKAPKKTPNKTDTVISQMKNNSINKRDTVKVLPSINVLVVEDNAINQAILGAFLRKHKIHYQIAKNGQEAVDKWRQGGFHLVLMDLQLPVKSGLEATKEIRNLEKWNKIGVFNENEFKMNEKHSLKEEEKLNLALFTSPVIIVALTASSNSSVDRTNALRAGCNDYLTKPVNLVWLQKKINEWGCMQALIDFDGWKFKSNSANIPVGGIKSMISSA